MEKRNLLILLFCVLFMGFIYGHEFVSYIKGTTYHGRFIKEDFDRLQIIIDPNYSTELKEEVILDKNEIHFFKNLFSVHLKYDWKKEKKLYHYSVFLKFSNTSSGETYEYMVFFDAGQIIMRPVALTRIGEKKIGYLFSLTDSEFVFYDKIMEMRNSK